MNTSEELASISSDNKTKFQRWLFFAALVVLIALSAWFALRADDGGLQGFVEWASWDSTNNGDAVREMATGAFAGGIIGMVILLFEQLRDDQRLTLEKTRAIRLRVREEAADDKRQLVLAVVNDLGPTIETFVGHASHWSNIDLTSRPAGPCHEFQEIRASVPTSISRCRRLVDLIDDEVVDKCFKGFCKEFSQFKSQTFTNPEWPWELTEAVTMQTDEQVRGRLDHEPQEVTWVRGDPEKVEVLAQQVVSALDSLVSCAGDASLPELETD